MRELSKSQANACEHATNKRCRCRCGGAFHGAGRVTEDELSLLAPDDPHRPASVRDPEQAALDLEAARAGVADWLATGVLVGKAHPDRSLIVVVDGRDGLAQLP